MWKLNQPDDAWRLGSGRYIQERGALLRLQGEVAALGKKPLYLTGENSFQAVLAQYPALAALREEVFAVYTAPCNLEQAKALCARVQAEGCDVVVGIGGGRIMDMTKLVAHLANVKMVMAPTLSATCAAYAPLSVVYSMEGCTEGAVFFSREVDCILADVDVLARQPVRCACAGMMDAMAKLVEMHHYDDSILAYPAMRMAVTLAQHVFDRLAHIAPSAMEDVEQGKPTPAVDEMVYLAIAGTGMVSGLASRWNYQSAIAHCFYDGVRAHFPRASSPYLHGEVVALGMSVQTRYTGWNHDVVFQALDRLNMPKRLADVGLEGNAKTLDTLYAAVLQGMKNTGRPIEKERLKACMQTLL